MSRSPAGVFTYDPTGHPTPAPNETIISEEENRIRNDIANALTESLDRHGRGGMLAPFRIADGTLAAPGLAFLNEPGTGLYRESPGIMSVAVQGTKVMGFAAGQIVVPAGVLLNVLGTFSTASLTVNGTFTSNGPMLLNNDGITFNGVSDVKTIITSSVDGADNDRIFINAFGATADATRGAWINLNGNEVAGVSGTIQYVAGDVVGAGTHDFYNSGSIQLRIGRVAGANRYLVIEGGTAAPNNPRITPSTGEQDLNFVNMPNGFRTSGAFFTRIENGFSNAPVGSGGAPAIEMGISGGAASIQGYNRGAGQYLPMSIAAATDLTVSMNGAIVFSFHNASVNASCGNLFVSAPQAVVYWNKTGAGARVWRMQTDIVVASDFGLYDQTGGRIVWSCGTDGVFTLRQVTNAVDMITSSGGQGRFGGWYTGGLGYQGAAVEVGFSGGFGTIIAFNRTAGAYQPLIVSGSDVDVNTNGSGGPKFSTVVTTANAANAFLDSGGANRLYRSTSTLTLKDVKRVMGVDEARNVVMRSQGIVYTSKSPNDNPLVEHVGFGAEQVFDVDARFVTFNAEKKPDWVQYPNFVVPLTVMVSDHEKRIAELERKVLQ